MVRAKRHQVAEIIGSALGLGGDVMDFADQRKATHDAAPTITSVGCFTRKSALATAPVGPLVSGAAIPFGIPTFLAAKHPTAFSIGEARIPTNWCSAVPALYCYFPLPSGACGQPLPFRVAGVRPTSSTPVSMRRILKESDVADRARLLFFTALIVSVVRTFVLMALQEPSLTTRRKRPYLNGLPATACAQFNGYIHTVILLGIQS